MGLPQGQPQWPPQPLGASPRDTGCRLTCGWEEGGASVGTGMALEGMVVPFWDSRGGGRLCTGPRPCLPSQQPLLGQYHFPQIPCLPPTWPLRCGPTWDGTEFPDAVSLQRQTGGVGKDGRVGVALQGGGSAGFMARDDLTLGKTRGRGSWKFQEMRSVGIPSCPNALQGSVVPAPLLRGRFLLPLCPPLCHRGQRGNGKPGSGHPEVRKRQ